MYWNSIFLFISLPVMVFISYLLVKYTVRKYESILEKPVKKAQAKQ